MRVFTASSLAGVALLALAGCSESVSTRLTAPVDGPLAARSGTPVRGLTSSAGVVPTVYSGNTQGEGNSACSALGYGSTGTKVDGAYSQKVGGYQFTVSGSGKQYLAFAPAGTPASTILAVIVKGGDAYDVYDYRTNPRTSDAGLTAPYNNGGNLPTISHYVVCYGPATPPSLTKTLTHVYIMVGDEMLDDPAWNPGEPVTIPHGETRWLRFDVDYVLPNGVTGTLTENHDGVCATAGPGMWCGFNTNQIYSWSVVGTGTQLVDIDLINQTACGDRTFTNTVTLTLVTGGTMTATSPVPLHIICE
jgi:hypothetical protein